MLPCWGAKVSTGLWWTGRGRQAAPSWQSCETVDETAIFYFCKTHTLMWIYLYIYIYVNNIHTYAFTYSYIVLCTYTKINTCITIIFYICHYMHSYVYIDIYRYICYTLYFNKYTCLRRFSPSSNHSPLFLLVFQPLELPQSPFQERHRCLRSLCWAHRCPPAQSNDAMAEACGNGGRKQPYPSVCQRCHMSHTIHSPSSIHRKWKL